MPELNAENISLIVLIFLAGAFSGPGLWALRAFVKRTPNKKDDAILDAIESSGVGDAAKEKLRERRKGR